MFIVKIFIVDDKKCYGFSAGSDKIFQFSKSQTQTFLCKHLLGFPIGSAVKNLPTVQDQQGTRVRFLGQEDPLGESMATHSSIHAWRISMDRGAWGATIHRVVKSQIRLKRLSIHAHTRTCIHILKTTRFKILSLNSIYVFSMRL